MKVLELNQKILRLLGVCLERNATQKERQQSAFANVFVLASFAAILGNNAMYFYVNLGNMAEAIFSLMLLVAFVAVTATYASFMLNKNVICEFFDELQGFVNESMWSFLFVKIENWTQWNPKFYFSI